MWQPQHVCAGDMWPTSSAQATTHIDTMKFIDTVISATGPLGDCCLHLRREATVQCWRGTCPLCRFRTDAKISCRNVEGRQAENVETFFQAVPGKTLQYRGQRPSQQCRWLQHFDVNRGSMTTRGPLFQVGICTFACFTFAPQSLSPGPH